MMKLPKKKHEKYELLSHKLEEYDFVKAMIVYGSWLFDDNSADMDVAVFIDSEQGIVDPKIYDQLMHVRQWFNHEVSSTDDLDLIPHTEDEYKDKRSPIWLPKSNQALAYGIYYFDVQRIYAMQNMQYNFTNTDLVAMLMHDTRTICRRQLTRNLDGEAGRIFVSKLLHGPANALTHFSCLNNRNIIGEPANLKRTFELFDIYFQVDSKPAWNFLFDCKRNFNRKKALSLMRWYEHLMGLVLYGKPSAINYEYCCMTIKKIDIKLPLMVAA